MTLQRISLARLTAGGMLVLAAFGASAQDTSRNSNPNPFQRPSATSAAPTAAPGPVANAPASAPSATSSVVVEQGPLALPPPIPLPPPGIAYPALSVPKMPAAVSAPVTKMLPPPIPALEEGPSSAENKPGKAGKQVDSPAADAPAKPRSFMAREKIEANRAKCQVSFKGRTLVQLSAGDTEQIIQLTGADGCLTAMSSDTDWLDVQYAGNNELVVSASANEDDSSRKGQVTVVTPKQTFILTVRQAAATPARAVVTTPVPAAAAVEVKKPAAASIAAPSLAIEPVKATVPVKADLAKVESAKVEPAVVAVEPELSEAARARMEDASHQPTSPSLSQHLAERVLVDIKVPAVVPMPMPSFELPEFTEPLRVLPALVTREVTVALVEPKPVSIPSVLSIALPEIKPTPAPATPVPPVTAAKPVVASQVKPVSPPAVTEPAQAAPVVPKTIEYKASAHVVEAEPVVPAADPARARSVLQAMLGIQEPASKSVGAKPATRGVPTPAVKGKPAGVPAAVAEKKLAAAVPPAPAKAKAVAVPDGYVTLDEYDVSDTKVSRK